MYNEYFSTVPPPLCHYTIFPFSSHHVRKEAVDTIRSASNRLETRSIRFAKKARNTKITKLEHINVHGVRALIHVEPR